MGRFRDTLTDYRLLAALWLVCLASFAVVLACRTVYEFARALGLLG